MPSSYTQTMGQRSFNIPNGGSFGFGNGKYGATDNGDGYLGNYSGTKTVTKTLNVPDGASELTLSFDFLELDSWDYEHFYVEINGHRVDLGDFFVNRDEGTHSWRDGGEDITYRKTASTDPTDFEGSVWVDQRHTYEVTIPGSLIDDGTLEIKWYSNTNQSAADESFGIDNFKVIATVLKADANDYTGALSQIEKVDMFAIGNQQLGSLYDTFSTRLEIMKDTAAAIGNHVGLGSGLIECQSQ